MDVLFIIKSHHVELMQAFDQMQAAAGLKPKRAAMDDLARDLQAFLTLEKDYLYPEIEDQFAGAGTLVVLGQAGGSLIDKRLKAVLKLIAKPVDEQEGLEKRIGELKEALSAHFDHEERVLMPKLRSSMRTEDREDLGQVMVDAQEDLRSGAADADADAAPAVARKRA